MQVWIDPISWIKIVMICVWCCRQKCLISPRKPNIYNQAHKSPNKLSLPKPASISASLTSSIFSCASMKSRIVLPIVSHPTNGRSTSIPTTIILRVALSTWPMSCCGRRERRRSVLPTSWWTIRYWRCSSIRWCPFSRISGCAVRECWGQGTSLHGDIAGASLK